MKSLWIQLFIALMLGYLLVEWVLNTLTKRPVKDHPDRVWRETWFWSPLAALLHAVMVYLLAEAWTLWWLPLTVFAFHTPIGYVLQRGNRNNPLPLRITAQFAFVILRVILFLALYCSGYGTPSWLNAFPGISFTLLILLQALILLVPLGGRLIGFVMAPFQAEMEEFRRKKQAALQAPRYDPEPKTGILKRMGKQLFGQQQLATPPAQQPPALPLQNGFKEGGKVIGYLERLLIFVFIAAGQYAGIGFLVVAKSIFRFGEFKDSENRMEAEYIIIGTFLSFLYAIVVSLLSVWLLL